MCVRSHKGSILGKFKASIFMIHYLIIHFWLQLVLSGDIESNPSPITTQLNGRINFGFWNLNSILARDGSKLNQLEVLQSCNNFDLFGICKSFLSDKIDNKELEINGFSPEPFRADSPLSNVHPMGGVCIL